MREFGRDIVVSIHHRRTVRWNYVLRQMRPTHESVVLLSGRTDTRCRPCDEETLSDCARIDDPAFKRFKSDGVDLCRPFSNSNRLPK
jgi:hypothetical protein